MADLLWQFRRVGSAPWDNSSEHTFRKCIGSSNCNTSTLMNNLFDNFTMGTNYEYFCMKSTRLNISAGKIEIFTNFCNVFILDPSDINVLHWAYTSSSSNSSIIVWRFVSEQEISTNKISVHQVRENPISSWRGVLKKEGCVTKSQQIICIWWQCQNFNLVLWLYNHQTLIQSTIKTFPEEESLKRK